MIKAIFFDFFGVISSEVSPFWFKKHFSVEEAARLKEEYMSPADRGDLTEEEVFMTLSELSGETPDEIRADFRSRLKIKDDTVALIEELRKRYPIVLVSNAMRNWLRNIILENGLYHLFDRIVISSEVRINKPERGIFEAALREAGVTADEAVFLDDNERNVRGAEALGIHGIVFTTAKEAKDSLLSLGVTV